MPVLYDNKLSRNGYKIRLLAAHAGLALERVEVDILKGESRTSDFVARIDEGRFCLLLTNTTSLQAHTVAMRVAAALHGLSASTKDNTQHPEARNGKNGHPRFVLLTFIPVSAQSTRVPLCRRLLANWNQSPPFPETRRRHHQTL